MKKTLVFLLCCFVSLPMWAGIMIYPKFLSFDDKTRVGEIMLMNSDSMQSANYRISLTYKRQNSDGSYTEITPEEAPADSALRLLRYSPRSVMLLPTKGQTIRVLKRLPENLPPGEYVVYITFTEVLLEKPLTKKPQGDNEFSVKLTPIPSFSIPIFVRHKIEEPSTAQLQIGGLKEIKGKTYLEVSLQRQAQTDRPITSIRGDLSVWNGDEMLGMMRGRYLLPGNNSISSFIPLQQKDASIPTNALKGKTLKVLFTKPSQNEIQPDKKMAEAEIHL